MTVSCPYYDAFIEMKRVRMLVDTGSAVSIVPARTYWQLFSHVPLRPAGKLAQWNGSGIKVLGKMSADVTGPDQLSVPAELYVAVGDVPIMGRDLQHQLGVTVSHGSVVCQVKQDQVLPAIKGFVHKVRLIPGAVPSTPHLRTLPHGVAEDEDQLVAALEEMLPAVSSADIAAAGLEDDEVKALISQIPQRWPSKLREVPPVLKPYFSPSELLHGRQLRTSLENAVVQSSDCRGDGAIQQHVRKKQRKMKRYHDRTARKPDIKRGPVSFELEGGIRVHAERLSLCHTSVRRPDVPGGGGREQADEPDLLPDDAGGGAETVGVETAERREAVGPDQLPDGAGGGAGTVAVEKGDGGAAEVDVVGDVWNDSAGNASNVDVEDAGNMEGPYRTRAGRATRRWWR
ncbi:hypothetical protein FJT64_014861 [Amphibalanus amphitrite]|uniref:Peptidase A2 domain-containing protein n=1 Tax=Amphibalanus amphitrite TaxID=1232801 RepID=A0A6A4V519_AMPAM|nr:hypothetical protein FJT64_014861 [Amphibalanus amphitrite]